MFAQRPLLEAIQEYHRDYLIQVKENQSKVLEQRKMIFEDATNEVPGDRKVTKKRGLLRFAACILSTVINYRLFPAKIFTQGTKGKTSPCPCALYIIVYYFL
ncbi:MAG: hypothetical protein FWC50_00270 [Planctomycetaceae bacterium]|nr:hypothetical protein [Planctomycetaceae bacterium]